MKCILYLLIIVLTPLFLFSSCKESVLESWEPYLSTGMPVTVNISLNKYEIDADAYACTESIEVSSDGGWTVSSSEEWCSTSIQESSMKQTLTVMVDENRTPESRHCRLTFVTTSGNKTMVEVSQKAKWLSVDVQRLSFSIEGEEEQNVAVVSNGNYACMKTSEWLNAKKTDTGYTIKVRKNDSAVTRVDTLFIFMTDLTSGEIKQKVVVEQSCHECVDLGLPSGLKWATCNVGASTPEESGNYFAWGKTEPWDTCYSSGYQWDDQYDPEPFGVCAPEDDAAHVYWSGLWRMPTYWDVHELMDYCSWEWSFLNGAYGMKISSKIDSSKFIFLPAVGLYDYESLSLEGLGECGLYWTGTTTPGQVVYFLEIEQCQYQTSSTGPESGMTIRPVHP